MPKIEVFTAGCACCDGAVTLVQELACENCTVEVVDMKSPGAAERAKRYGLNRVPAVVVNGELCQCCQNEPVSREALMAAGVGRG